MSKHTPGPWIYWDENSGRPKNYDLMHLTGKNGYQILNSYGGAGFKALGRSETDIANAQLIAAAPDLLEACKGAIASWPTDGGPLGSEIAYTDMEKAIAKAEKGE